jgi:hypothetical protein
MSNARSPHRLDAEFPPWLMGCYEGRKAANELIVAQEP